MPNEREVCLIADEPDIELAIATLRQRVPLLIIKRGAKGASAYTKHKAWDAPTVTTKIVDAVGAGDSFNAGFLHGWIRDWPVERALALGNCAGARSTEKSGGTAAFRDRKSIEALTSAWLV